MSKENLVVVIIVLLVPISAAVGGYTWGMRNASQDVRTEWCASLGGQVSDDLCVKDNRVVLRWDN